MKYIYTNKVRENEVLRESFNELTRKTFCFDFKNWYEKGHWRDKYVPHVLLDGDKVISNVSVNYMKFLVNGQEKQYLQLGTVMTDPDYRGQGLNRYIMEQILQEYQGKVDGIYLFGNDDVVNYYPKFGFRSAKEYGYSKKVSEKADTIYEINKVDAENIEEWKAFYEAVSAWNQREQDKNDLNDGFCLCNNVDLYFFWLESEYRDSIYYVSAADAYVVADVDGAVANVYQVFGAQKLSLECFVHSLWKNVTEIVLHYTPADKTGYEMTEHKEEDCTLFLLGEALDVIERDKLRFSVMSHA